MCDQQDSENKQGAPSERPNSSIRPKFVPAQFCHDEAARKNIYSDGDPTGIIDPGGLKSEVKVPDKHEQRARDKHGCIRRKKWQPPLQSPDVHYAEEKDFKSKYQRP